MESAASRRDRCATMSSTGSEATGAWLRRHAIAEDMGRTSRRRARTPRLCPSLREALSRKPENVGALAFKRAGDPSLGNFADATILKTFGEVPSNLDEL